jgi:hypothetical protein
VEDILQWPWKRFERFYQAFIKRQVVESMERRKEALIAACWANSNYDDDKGTRQNLVDEIEDHFRVATLAFLSGKDSREEEEYRDRREQSVLVEHEAGSRESSNISPRHQR